VCLYKQQIADSWHVSSDEVLVHFAELEGPRSTANLQHPLVSVVVIALMAVLAGASGPTAIGEWAAMKAEFLLNTLDSPNGVPRKDVFRRWRTRPPPAVGVPVNDWRR
jgi:DDE_Tnp_1-associated